MKADFGVGVYDFGFIYWVGFFGFFLGHDFQKCLLILLGPFINSDIICTGITKSKGTEESF